MITQNIDRIGDNLYRKFLSDEAKKRKKVDYMLNRLIDLLAEKCRKKGVKLEVK